MKAFVIQKPDQVEMIEVPKYQLEPNEVLVRVGYAGLCATDLAILSGDMSLIRNGSIKFPVRFGHEWSGVVEAVGSEVTDFVRGDRVVSETAVTCGVCEHCQNKDWNNCETTRSLGTVNCWDGGFAEYMHIPARHLYKLPDSVSLKEAALIEPTCIALSGIRKTEIQPGKTVLIIGTGAIGLASVGLAKCYGADKIILAGRKDAKLEIGRQMGADILINTTKVDLEEAVIEETNGRGADAVIETSGSISVVANALHLAANKGRIGLIGFYEKTVPAFEIDEIVMKSLVVSGVMGEFNMPGDIIELMASGKLDLSPMITHIIPFEETANVMYNIADYGDTRIKILAEVGGETPELE